MPERPIVRPRSNSEPSRFSIARRTVCICIGFPSHASIEDFSSWHNSTERMLSAKGHNAVNNDGFQILVRPSCFYSQSRFRCGFRDCWLIARNICRVVCGLLCCRCFFLLGAAPWDVCSFCLAYQSPRGMLFAIFIVILTSGSEARLADRAGLSLICSMTLSSRRQERCQYVESFGSSLCCKQGMPIHIGILWGLILFPRHNFIDHRVVS